MKLLFINNRLFFKYVNLEETEFYFMNNNFYDDPLIKLIDVSDRCVILEFVYPVYGGEIDKKLKNGIHEREILKSSKEVKIFFNSEKEVDYTLLNFDFEQGFINKPHKITFAYLESESLNLRTIDKDGISYVGGVNGLLKEGFGELKYKYNRKYVGEFKDDKKNGYGSMITKDEMYVGEYKNDYKNGHGIVYQSDGTRYEGEFISNMANGCGIFHYEDGTYELAKYYNDNLIGDENQDMRIYLRYKESDFISDLALIVSKGAHAINDTLCLLIEDFNEDKITGKIIYMIIDDETQLEHACEKHFTINRFDFITIPYTVINDSKNKFAYLTIGFTSEKLTNDDFVYKYCYTNGNIFEGEYDGAYPKKGKVVMPNGAYYLGELEKGKLEGFGEFHYENGDKIIGKFSDNMPDGIVDFYFSDGTKIKRKYFAFTYPNLDGADMYKDIEE